MDKALDINYIDFGLNTRSMGKPKEIPRLPFQSYTKITDRLYQLVYNNIDYDFGKEFINNRYTGSRNHCTVVATDGGIIGRNLDELYDNSVSALIKVSPREGLNGFTGLVSGVPFLTAEVLDGVLNEDGIEILKAIPFYMMDVANNDGLFVEINLLNTEISKGRTTGTIPTEELRDTVYMPMLPMYIVDHYSSVDDAIEGITKYVSVKAPASATLTGEAHFFLKDSSKAVILEFVNNEVYTREVGNTGDYPAIMANFYVKDVTLNDDNTITRNTSDDPDEENDNGVTPYGSGIERHNIAVNGLSLVSGVEDMMDLMRDLFYTQAYTLNSDKWYTEFVGKSSFGDLRVTSPTADFAEIMTAATNAYNNRDRNDPKTWQTIHSAVYEMDYTNGHHKIYVCVQEGLEYHRFDFSLNTIGEVVDSIGNLDSLETDHKSDLVSAINELVDIAEKSLLVITTTQSTNERKVIYNACIANPHISKNVVFLNGDDNLYYVVNGYKIDNGILYLNTLMVDTGTIRSVTLQILSNGSIVVS